METKQITETNKTIVSEFIQKVWNEKRIDLLDEYVDDEYKDHSFLPSLPPTKEGLKFWINNTSNAFEHHTKIESALAEGDEVALRITFNLKHVGIWRGIEPTAKEVCVKGFRFYKLKDGKLVAHWALIDGEAIQNGLTNTFQGCKLPS